MHRPIAIELGNVVEQVPPPPPSNGNIVQTILWSLSFRLFAWNNSPTVPVPPDIRLYLWGCSRLALNLSPLLQY